MKSIFFFQTSLVKEDKVVVWHIFAQNFCPSVFGVELDSIFIFIFFGS